MSIVEAATIVLSEKNADSGLTIAEITKRIIDRDLYKFKTPNPSSVVNHAVRRHCAGLDFPSASPYKVFYIICENSAHETKYQLISKKKDNEVEINDHGMIDTDSLPEEKIDEYIHEHIASIQQKLLDNIMNNPPAFFEALVVELLIKIGYGYDEKSGNVVGKPHDGGVDGIINQDALGLEKIYIQAKRYSKTQTIGRPEIQAFAGAMMTEGVKKGVFITTSSFKKTAIDYADQIKERSISLVDGEMLTSLMVKYGIGVRVVRSFNIYDIETDFFSIE